MSAAQILDTKAGQVLALAAVGALALWYVGRKAGTAAAAVGEALNPTSPNNIAYGAANSIGSAITGDAWWNLGGALYDWTHPDAEAIREAIAAGTVDPKNNTPATGAMISPDLGAYYVNEMRSWFGLDPLKW